MSPAMNTRPPALPREACDTLDTGAIYTVTLSTILNASLYGNVVGGGDTVTTETITASVDPEIIVPSGYSVVMSPSPAVPEPSTWAMMLAGFACLAFAGFRTTRKSAALAV